MKYGSHLILELPETPIIYDFTKFDSAFDIMTTAGTRVINIGNKLKTGGHSITVRLKHLWKASLAVEFQSIIYFGRKAWCVVYDTDDNPEDYKEELNEIISKVSDWAVALGPEGNLDRVKKFSTYFGDNPRYVIVPMNPLKYRREIIDYCKERDIEIIAEEIYGNKESEEWMKETFTTDYLERFAGIHSDGLVLRMSERMSEFLYSYDAFIKRINEEPGDTKMFDPGKDVWTDKVKPATRKIKATGMRVGDSYFPWPSSRNSGRVVLSFKDQSRISDSFLEKSEILEEFEFPENFTDIEKRNYSEILGISKICSMNPGMKPKFDFQEDYASVTLKSKWMPWKKGKFYICTYLKNNPVLLKWGN